MLGLWRRSFRAEPGSVVGRARARGGAGKARSSAHSSSCAVTVVGRLRSRFVRYESPLFVRMCERCVRRSSSAVVSFSEPKTCTQVLLWMTEHELHFPRPSDGQRTTSFDWRPVRYRNVISVLKNPFYAGAYAFGKKTFRTDVVDGRALKKYGCTSLPMSEWRVLIEDHHRGYIDWQQYEANQQQLARNTFGRAGGAAKSGRGGKALLPGLLRCRRCGHILNVVYAGRSHTPKYRCGRSRSEYGDGWCIQFGARTVDQTIASAILEVVQPWQSRQRSRRRDR